MKIIAISGLLLAGAVSVVTAAPAKDETAERVSYTEAAGPQADRGDTIELASPTPTKHGRTFVTVDPDHGRIVQLRVQAHQGRPVVKTVEVVYADGKSRTVKVGRALAGKRATHVIDLKRGTAIDHIVIVADKRSRGSYVVHAMPARASNVATR
jgi:hypothetical protein